MKHREDRSRSLQRSSEGPGQELLYIEWVYMIFHGHAPDPNYTIIAAMPTRSTEHPAEDRQMRRLMLKAALVVER
jgi:hypothetical protein